MNESDSERIAIFLEKKGYQNTDKIETADLIVVNACSVRQMATDRVFGLGEKIKKLKQKNPKLKAILTGCLVEKDKQKFKKLFNEIIDIKKFYKVNSYSGLVPIMTGCDNFCTYCVVPYTRGRETSRPINEILKEIKNLIKQGNKEIMLLGQNVNSYKHNFAKLLEKINSISGDFKVRFITNHPKGFSSELIKAIAKCDKVVKEIHLPIQSGDNQILKKMNRQYTVERYKKLVEKIREKIPNVKISTDVIVGFPGETIKQFNNTVNLFKEINYDLAFINKYSPREGTVAFKFKDDVSYQEKKRRWVILEKIVNQKDKLKTIVVCGPTASGKSDLAIKLAKEIKGEVISADSRQVYKGMDIGTAKITAREMGGIPHYLLDVASPKRQFTVSQYKKLANKVLKDIWKKKKIPLVCGGTGLYIQTLVEGLEIPEVKPDKKLRTTLEKETTAKLFAQLKKLDPRRAKNIDSKNRRRLIRALEIVLITGKPVPSINYQVRNRQDILYLGVKRPEGELKALIKKRIDQRLKKGMVAEVKKLKASGLSWQKIDDFGLEYRYLTRFLQGKITREEMIDRIQIESEKYAKRQMTWFKRNKKIHWVDNYQEAKKLVKDFIKN